MGHIRDVIPSQSTACVLNELNLTHKSMIHQCPGAHIVHPNYMHQNQWYFSYKILTLFLFYSCELISVPVIYTVVILVLWRCWLRGRKGTWPVKKWGDSGGGHWLVRMEWHPAGWSVCLPPLIFPCTIKSRSSLLAPAHPVVPEKQP